MSKLILAFESSCDETACAISRDGREILADVVYSQADMHALYGGVVPEIASRKHVEKISLVAEQAVKQAGIKLSHIDAVAATCAPGLIGALLVGANFAKATALALNKPFVPVHHIRGHVAANYIAFPELEPPMTALVASGGHTVILDVADYTHMEVVGASRDDAAGEAFDKVARVIGLGYPGGPKIEALAKEGNPDAIRFPQVEFADTPYDFSFSGVKTSVINYLHTKEQKNEEFNRAELAASFQKAVVEALTRHTIRAAKDKGTDKVVLAGGVSANGALRASFEEATKKEGLGLFYPQPILCTDNAAMIGSAGFYKYLRKDFADSGLNAVANLKL